jgi:succinoglycan biosynthesis protein ExoM
MDFLIPTYRRPRGLAALLDSIVGLRRADELVDRIVVVDNDPQGSARSVVDTFRATHAVPVVYVQEAARGVVHVRNTALRHAETEYVAFVDDDELLDPGWAVAVTDAARATGADAVFGRVESIFPEGTPRWIAGMRKLERSRVDPNPTSGSTNNVLIRLESVRRAGIEFDPRFARSGGEDTDFFHRLHRAGCRFVYCDAALAHEPIDPARNNLRWYWIRNYRVGQTNAIVFGRGRGLRGVLRLSSKIVAVALLPWALPFALPLGAARSARLLLAWARNAGFLTAMLGYHTAEY